MGQYIGARYVPKFMGLYDATQVYENLCVVDNGLGTSYISRKPTPAGTPLTDTNFWAVYGASSGAIINLQNQIDDINIANYVLVSSFDTGDDTTTLQAAVDSAAFLLMDRDYVITSAIAITKPIKFNLGGHRLSATSDHDDVIDIYTSNVEIFNGEIYNTVDTPENPSYGGKCVMCPNPWGAEYQFPPIVKNISLHDLYMSTNGNSTCCYTGETFNSEMYNIILDGNRANKGTFSLGVSCEWHGTPHVDTYHPHNVTFRNIRINNMTNAFRFAGVFNFDVINAHCFDCDYGVYLVPGDWGNEAAQARYKECVNKNINFENFNTYYCTYAFYVIGTAYGTVDFSVKNAVIDGNNKASSGALRMANAVGGKFKNIECVNTALGALITDSKNVEIDGFNAHDVDTYGAYLLNDDNITIKNSNIYNCNQSGGSTMPVNSGITLQGSTMCHIEGNKIGFGDTEGISNDIGSLGTNTSSLVTNNIYHNALSYASATSIIDNNIQA